MYLRLDRCILSLVSLWAVLAIVDCRAAGAASTPPQLVPNPDFNQGGSAPVGWTLSGGQGRWVDHKILEVTGDGSDSNHWQCSCRFTPGGLYRFQVRARSVGGGRAGFTGPGFANRDQALSDSWVWYGHVFRAPDGVTSDDVRIGQWHAAGSSQFDAVRLAPVVAVHAAVRPEGWGADVSPDSQGIASWTPPPDMMLGDGETIHAGHYTFLGEFSHEGSNYHRTLQSATAGFNSNRWCLSGDGQVTYRFDVPGYPFRSGSVRLGVSYHERGGCLAEISRDQASWRPLLTKSAVGAATADVPADLLPADVLYLRLRTSAPNGAFQVNDVEFSGDLAGNPPEGVGRTEFAEISSTGDDLSVERIALDSSNGYTRPTVWLFGRNRSSSDRLVSFSWRLGRSQPDDSGKNPSVDRFAAPLGQAQMTRGPGGGYGFSAEATLAAPGHYKAQLTIRAADRQVVTATVPLTLPDYYREDYGRRIERATGNADVWWCEATWKVAPSRKRRRPWQRPRRFRPPATTARQCRWWCGPKNGCGS